MESTDEAEVEITEATIIVEGMPLVVEKGWTSVEIESDSKVLIDQIKGELHTGG